MTKKLKPLLINSILNFVNTAIINEVTDTSIKVNSISLLVKIDQKIIGNTTREFNLNLLNSTLKEIFSNDITSKIKEKEKNYNKEIIDDIYLDNKKGKIINILKMTLSQRIKHLTNKEYYPELQGLEDEYENIINKLKTKGETEEYIELFKDLLGRFEEFYKNKRKLNGNKNREKKVKNSQFL